MKIFAIDPGTIKSALVFWDSEKEIILNKGIMYNNEILFFFSGPNYKDGLTIETELIIEKMQSFGMPVGETVLDTCIWIGRFFEAWGDAHLVTRKDVCLHHCKSRKAKDKDIRAALIKRFGKPGTKKNPGKLYGVSKDIWSALAIAVFWGDTN